MGRESVPALQGPTLEWYPLAAYQPWSQRGRSSGFAERLPGRGEGWILGPRPQHVPVRPELTVSPTLSEPLWDLSPVQLLVPHKATSQLPPDPTEEDAGTKPASYPAQSLLTLCLSQDCPWPGRTDSGQNSGLQHVPACVPIAGKYAAFLG